MDKPSVAVVILNWNGKKYLERFLPSVQASTYPNKRIIVADNGSTDDSIVFLRRSYPQVEILPLERNLGFAKGYNEALGKVRAEYFILLNSDVQVTPGWIEPIIDLMEKDPTLGACQPKILSYSDASRFEYAGAAGGWIDALGYPFARGRVFDTCEADQGQYDEPAPVFWAGGAAFFVRSSLYHALNGLDEYFFAHQEEIDFCWRLQLAGFRVYACPASVVYHLGGATLGRGKGKKVFLNYRNNLIMLAKNLSSFQKLWKIPLRVLLDALSGWKYLLEGNGFAFLAIVQAHLAFLIWIFSGKRQKSGGPKNPRLDGWYSGSIVWAYFVEGKKSFEQIVKKKS
jgi:GT2 family glycosyltransferase